MTNLRDIPSPADRAAWPSYLDAVQGFIEKPSVTLEELALGGELYNRLHPILCGWAHELDRYAQDRLRGLASAKPEPGLQVLHNRLGMIVGRLREFAALTNAGSPEYPVTIHHERLAAAVAAERARNVREESKRAENPRRRWTPLGWMDN